MRTRHALGAVILVASAFTLSSRVEARADALSPSAALTDAINNLRISLGIAPLTVDPSLGSVAQAWSQQMAEADDISHNPELASEAPAGWRLLGENTGTGPDVAAVGQGLLASPEHYANMVDPYFDVVGVAAATDASGTLFVTEDFMETPAPAPAVQHSVSAPVAAQPVVTTPPPVSSPSASALAQPSAAARPSAPAQASAPAPAPTSAPAPASAPGESQLEAPAVVAPTPSPPRPAPVVEAPAEPVLVPPARPGVEGAVRTAGSRGAPSSGPVPSLPGAIAGAGLVGLALSVLRVLQVRRPRPTW